MDTRPALKPADRALGAVVVGGAWAIYLPLGMMYLALLLTLLLSGWVLMGQQRWREVMTAPGLRWAAALAALMALSALWSAAPAAEMPGQVWHYLLCTGLPLVTLGCPPEAAQRALGHFVAASALVAVLVVLGHFGLLPASPLWRTTVDAVGNQRIGTSLWLALGCALAVARASSARAGRSRWLLAGVITALALSLQDRRTGMALLPLLLLALAFTKGHSRSLRWGAAAVVVLAAALAWQASSTVRARFAEGITELQAPAAAATVATSWGQRLQMVHITLDMIREAPLLGHGVGGWLVQWQQRTVPGTPLAKQTTPHNEYLMVASQTGLVGLALLIGWLLAQLRAALRQGDAGVVALLVWLSMAGAGLFNVVLRDAKFGVPLLMLAALAGAMARKNTISGVSVARG